MKHGPKKRWGSHPQRERGSVSASERAYLAMASRAIRAGELAADNPKATEAWCPASYNEEQGSYWLDAFRRRRRK